MKTKEIIPVLMQKNGGFLLIVQLLFCFLPLYTIKMSQIYKKCLILKTVYHIFPY